MSSPLLFNNAWHNKANRASLCFHALQIRVDLFLCLALKRSELVVVVVAMVEVMVVVRKSVIATSLVVAVSLLVVVVNYSEKPYVLLQPVFGQTFSSHWMFSRQPHRAFKPHPGLCERTQAGSKCKPLHSLLLATGNISEGPTLVSMPGHQF
ncbi:hypothetical protein N1851_015790 [Merluccius polli]|uniref:Uncharacterized protein n=1 Tax=Merluccius polli TaxID=89951 RepID=A0AA47MSF8_MERPO|nr:hypothetical protein N1851_015790 [Merluccius polli]